MVKLVRSDSNPILIPSESHWENMLVFNPGAILHEDKTYLIYRAMGEGSFHSRLGLAVSDDGIHFTREHFPMYYGGVHESESLGFEDPRVVKIDDTIYMVYTAVSVATEGSVDPAWKEQIAKQAKIALSTTTDFVNFHNYGTILSEISGKNASLFPKKVNDEYWMLYRKEQGQTFFTHSPRLDSWNSHSPVFDKRSGYWDSIRVGIGAPPIETERGWLLFYHGVDESNTYRIGVMFLDLNDPTQVLYRSPEPVFEPETDYEKYGFIPNVVFTCGVVEHDASYYIYYGAADQVIGLATVSKQSILDLF